MNEQQLLVYNSKETKILVEASAGTGKTTLLTACAQKAVDENPKNEIALVTFTNAAADNMSEKMNNKPKNIFIGTLHVFCLTIIDRLVKKYKLKTVFLTKEQISIILENIFEENDYFPTEEEFKKCLEYITNSKRFLEENELDSNETILFEIIQKEYVRYKTQIHAYDLLDAPIVLNQLLPYYPDDRVLDYLFVDEAQDLSKEEYELIKTVNSKHKFVIGDPRQSIYMWRDALPKIFNNFKKDGYITYSLDNNYRSKQEIIDFAKVKQKAVRGKGGRIYTKIQGIMGCSPMILCRSNREVDSISPYYPKVQTIHAAKGQEYPSVLLVNFPRLEEEDFNIWFVGCTRAQDNLGVFSFKEVMKYLKEVA